LAPTLASRFDRSDNLAGRALQIHEMLSGEVFDREGRLDPEEIDRPIDPPTALERNRDRGELVIDGPPVRTADESRVARAVSS
jgi:hypothetical protein